MEFCLPEQSLWWQASDPRKALWDDRGQTNANLNIFPSLVTSDEHAFASSDRFLGKTISKSEESLGGGGECLR